jgi:DNA repair exonuclease SbcCD ATPase subunit
MTIQGSLQTLPFDLNAFEPFRSLIEKAQKQVGSQSEAVESERKMMEELSIMVHSECPSFSDEFQAVIQRIQHHFRCIWDLSEAQSRSVEDLRDIIERCSVVCRASTQAKNLQSEVQKNRKRFQDSRVRLEKEVNPGKRRDTLIAQMTESKEVLKGSLQKLKLSMSSLLEEIEKFRRFQIRKVRGSYFLVGHATEILMNIELNIWSDIDSVLNSLEQRILCGWHDYPETVPIIY